jgi:hypothetical protein
VHVHQLRKARSINTKTKTHDVHQDVVESNRNALFYLRSVGLSDDLVQGEPRFGHQKIATFIDLYMTVIGRPAHHALTSAPEEKKEQ